MTVAKTLDQDTAALVREALSAAKLGDLARACNVAERGLASGGDAAVLNAMLGMLRCQSGDLERGVAHLRVALALQPRDLKIATNLTAALIEQGDHQGALAVATPERAAADETLRLARFRGFAAQSVGDHAAATGAYEDIVTRAPDDWEAWNNLGNARGGTDDHQGSVEALRRAAQLNAAAPPVRLNYAMALKRAGEVDQAERQLREMAAHFPDDTKSLRELHLLVKAQSREEDALEAIEAAAARDPSDLELRLAVASQRLLLLDTDAAEAAYRGVVAVEPGNALANLGLAVTYDLANRADALARLVDDASARGVDPDALNFIRAFDHRRAKRFADGLAALEQVPDALEETRQLHLLGQLREGLGDSDAAFHAFAQMNELSEDDASQPAVRAAFYRAGVRKQFEMATPEWAAAWRPETQRDARPSPVFLVGFPRSGTTLLDTILMGHPRIDVLEEEPTLRRAGELLPDFALLPTASDADIQAARDAYFDTSAAHTTMTPGNLLLDKNPLAMNMLPLIHRLFPDARIILALRHPCDVLLSCFNSNFKLNDAMANFIRLDTAAELYDLSFSYLEHAQKLFDMPMHRIVYENIVSDRERELRSLLDFLSLDWSGEMLDHQTTALARGRIKTASYAQVVEPIYTRSAGRWKSYRAHLEPVLPILAPWIRKFGYEV